MYRYLYFICKIFISDIANIVIGIYTTAEKVAYIEAYKFYYTYFISITNLT